MIDLFVSMESIDILDTHGFFLDNQFRPGHFKDFVGPGQAHFILEALREPERLRETDLLLGSVVRKLGTVDIHIFEVELRETSFLGQCDAGFTEGKIEMDTGVIDLIPGIQRPHAVNGPCQVSGMADIGYATGCQHGQAGDGSRKNELFHNSNVW